MTRPRASWACAAALLALSSSLSAAPGAPAGPLERDAAAAGKDFDGNAAPPGAPPAPGAAAKAAALSSSAKSALSEPKEPARPKAEKAPPWRPTGGLGPVSTGKKPGYGRGLLGGLLGLLLAPVMFAWEAVQTVVSLPYRMVKGLIDGDGWSILEPLRTAKNLVQDGIMTAVGMVNSATAPVYNALAPERATDFQFVDHRLVFVGGPFEHVLNGIGWAACTPSQHTVFMKRSAFSDPSNDKDPSLFTHEWVHGVQWKESFAWEKQSHDFVGKDYSAARKNLDW